MYTLGARAWLLKMQAKRAKCKQEDTSPKRAMISSLGDLASPCGFLSLSLSAFSLEPCL